MTTPNPRVVYFRVPLAPYPRSERIITFLRAHGIEPQVIRGGELRSVASIGWLLRDLWRLWRQVRKGTYVLLAELQQKYAALTWAVVRLRGGILVVDGFVGAEETVVNVRQGERAAVARWLARGFDRLAMRAADWVLIDTDMRRDDLRRRHRTLQKGSGRVLTLPVGSPAWSAVVPPVGDSDALRVLYYGNYIPLHGAEHLVEGVALASREVRLTMVGDGRSRGAVEARVAELDLDVEFVGRVAERELADLIARSDVVAGIFGGSPKAGSVIANKVWQGLAAGRWVVTRTSPALEEIRDTVGDWLVEVPDRDAGAIAAALDVLAQSRHRGPVNVGELLEAYVARRFTEAFRAIGIV